MLEAVMATLPPGTFSKDINEHPECTDPLCPECLECSKAEALKLNPENAENLQVPDTNN